MHNPFAGLTLPSFGLAKSEASAIGIDIGSSSVKVVQLKEKGGKAILETYGELSLGPYGGLEVGQAVNLGVPELAAALKDLFREANVTSKNAAISIPLRSSLIHVIEVPALSQKELAQVIPIEARKYIPVPISEVVLDWWVIPKREFDSPGEVKEVKEGESTPSHSKLEVLLVAIHQETITKTNELIGKLGLEKHLFEVETFSAIRSVTGRDIAPIAILDLGASTSKLTILDYGVVKVSHVISKGAQDVTQSLSTALSIPFAEAERRKRTEGLGDRNAAEIVSTVGAASGDSGAVMSSIVDYIFYECQRALLDFQKKYGRIVSKVILVGGGTLLRGVLPLASKTFQAETFAGHSFDKAVAPAFLQEILTEAGPEFSVAVGLALRKLQENG